MFREENRFMRRGVFMSRCQNDLHFVEVPAPEGGRYDERTYLAGADYTVIVCTAGQQVFPLVTLVERASKRTWRFGEFYQAWHMLNQFIERRKKRDLEVISQAVR